MQASMMFKLVTARAINSAFLLFIITKDEDQLDDQTLAKVWYCMWRWRCAPRCIAPLTLLFFCSADFQSSFTRALNEC